MARLEAEWAALEEGEGELDEMIRDLDDTERHLQQKLQVGGGAQLLAKKKLPFQKYIYIKKRYVFYSFFSIVVILKSLFSSTVARLQFLLLSLNTHARPWSKSK
jgi:hypothetical protein